MIKLKQFPLYSEEFLRQTCKPVETKEQATDLKEALLGMFPKEGAYGVSAPQIGIHRQAFLVKFPSGQWLFACNAQIVSREEPFVFSKEGCLSFPKKSKQTDRYKHVTFTYQDEELEEHKSMVEDIEAVVIQHEIDHTNGILYFDHAICGTIKNVLRIGRNDPCICGSGKKYKKCCLDKV
ncbi:MAG: hypothetical protein E2O29_01900 [Deltaproteobacteria bacterium]|nr:MAG: hypothetical protein E2O29_01900 [Deltaproteobacteria bacterium]